MLPIVNDIVNTLVSIVVVVVVSTVHFRNNIIVGNANRHQWVQQRVNDVEFCSVERR